MSERDSYPAGVPCWVETLQPDPRAALDFYLPLFGWDVAGPGAMPDDPPAEYFVTRVKGRDIAGIGSIPPGSGLSPTWTTYIRVDNVDECVRRSQEAGGILLAGPFDAPPAGRMAALADTTGAAFCIWEAGTREGAQLVNESRAWAMSTLHTTDPQGAKQFYGAVFGWKAEALDFGGLQIALWRLPGYVGGEPQQPVPRDVVAVMVPTEAGSENVAPPHWSVDFWVDDADGTAARAAKLGGSIVAPPHNTSGFRRAVLADRQGATFSISQLTAGTP